MVDAVVGGKYFVGKKIGNGSFGTIYDGWYDISEEKRERGAIKMEPIQSLSR